MERGYFGKYIERRFERKKIFREKILGEGVGEILTEKRLLVRKKFEGERRFWEGVRKDF